MACNLQPGPDWVPGVIMERLGLVTYLVQVDYNYTRKRHDDQLKSLGEKSLVPKTAHSDADISQTEVPVPHSQEASSIPEPENEDDVTRDEDSLSRASLEIESSTPYTPLEDTST